MNKLKKCVLVTERERRDRREEQIINWVHDVTSYVQELRLWVSCLGHSW
jgi:hypothetical protein